LSHIGAQLGIDSHLQSLVLGTTYNAVLNTVLPHLKRFLVDLTSNGLSLQCQNTPIHDPPASWQFTLSTTIILPLPS
jgi:hypothetical protein